MSSFTSTGFDGLNGTAGKSSVHSALVQCLCFISLPKVLTDRHSVVFAALCGRPSNEAWSEVATSADRTIEAAGMKLKASCDKHRRGAFPAIIAGVSHGGGRQVFAALVCSRARRCN